MTPRVPRPVARAYMMSLLAVRKLQLGIQFPLKFPHSWLLWEPGAWQPAASGSPTMVSGTAEINARPTQGDALCFELVGPRALKVGRAPECDLVLNDGTVSREHLLLEPVALPDSWSVQPLPGASALLAERPLLLPTPLLSGTRLRLGAVTLTFYTPEAFGSRVDETLKEGQG